MIYDETKKKIVVKKAVFANSFFQKAFGLMFKSKKEEGMVFIFDMENNQSFHTFFCFFALDFVFLNKKKKVVRIIRNVKPWNVSISGVGKYIIELPAGLSKNISINDTISFK